MIGQETLLVTLVRLVNRVPLVAPVKQAEAWATGDVSGSAVSAGIGDHDCAASVYGA